MAVLVDRPGKDPRLVKGEDDDYEECRFVVKRITVDGHGSYFKAAREIKNWLDNLDRPSHGSRCQPTAQKTR
ncbi:MAG: hypothetical protein HY236_03180 [Acidobacteria bacterium]|nr:hypothetical protein [Acidobacteriota bacterium]